MNTMTETEAAVEQAVDKRTGRLLGDHGTCLQAITYSLDESGTEAVEFLHAWRSGDLQEWPEFYAWLKSPAGEKAK